MLFIQIQMKEVSELFGKKLSSAFAVWQMSFVCLKTFPVFPAG